MSTVNCFHCGDECSTKIHYNDKVFCCNGCKMVYEILQENGLNNYYNIENNPGVKPVSSHSKYDFLENEELANTFYDFKDDEYVKVTLFLPQIHCSSCVWLLENLSKLNKGILNSEIHFTKKEAYISYNPNLISLYELAHLLEKIGYPPAFEKQEKRTQSKLQKSFYIKLGITGFCFGNIMLLSFPEYLGVDNRGEWLGVIFQICIFILALPILFFSAFDYLKSGYKSLKTKHINIDVPISVGIITLFLKSSYDILVLGNAGYMDSFAGFIFFLLLGKWFQNKTYSALSFERDYKSYFPMAVGKLEEGKLTMTPIADLNKEDVIQIKNQDIIPTDGILLSDKTSIDYSFVTGESTLKTVLKGEKIFAGGKQVGAAIQLEVQEKVNQSYLTHLWNQSAFNDEKSVYSEINYRLSKYFTLAVLLVALLASVVWFFIDATQIVNVVVSILIVACPCALALAVPFTFGSSIRFYGRNGLYLRDIYTVEKMASITDLVFDKTGTITHASANEIVWEGKELTEDDKQLIKSLTQNSSHFLSERISDYLKGVSSNLPIENYKEEVGKGISALYKNEPILIGSALFVGEKCHKENTTVYVKINNEILGCFIFYNQYREGVNELKNTLGNYKLHILSGDNNSEEERLKSLLGDDISLSFNQKPIDKLNYIKYLQENVAKVLMLGDGLNDAGALKQANVGVVLSENIYNFSPASDAILNAQKFDKLPHFLSLSKQSIKVLKVCFSFSLLYNLIGLSFALTGTLSPLVAAILMPISSITVVFISTLLVQFKFNKELK